MPELPEVETIRRGLHQRIVGKVIEAVDTSASTGSLRQATTRPLPELIGQTVHDTSRHGKAMRWHLDNGLLEVHLGMTGKLLLDCDAPNHTHATWRFEDGTKLHFSDPRRFGWLNYRTDGKTSTDRYGIDALDRSFTAAHLDALLRTSSAPLKSFLLDQTKIAGIGNIYACEALWDAQLSPRRLAKNTPRGKVEPLRDAIVAVLEKSLAAGGTSFNDYVDSIGEKGSFLFDVAVFQRVGKPCPRCHSLVRRMVQSGRSTFYCGACQR